MKRYYINEETYIDLNDYNLYTNNGDVQELNLQPLQKKFVKMLTDNVGCTVTKEKLVDSLWTEGDVPENPYNSISKAYSSIKRNCEILAACIKNHRKLGYELKKPQISEYDLVEAKKHDETLKQMLDTAIEDRMHGEMYDGLSYLKEIVEPFFFKYAKEDSTVLDMGYKLTDLYDRTNNHDRAVAIADEILDVIGSTSSTITSENLRKMIGCTYSKVIAKTETTAQKYDNLIKGKEIFDTLKQIVEGVSKDTKWIYNNDNEKDFIIGLFYSNYASYFLNMANITVNTIEKSYLLNGALYQHEQSLTARKRLVKNTSKDDKESYKEAMNRLMQSVSNIGFTHFKMGRYSESLENRQELVDYWTKHGDVSRACLEKLYIIGANTELLKSGVDIDEQEYEKCVQYINELEKYYFTRDKRRYGEILMRKEEISAFSHSKKSESSN